MYGTIDKKVEINQELLESPRPRLSAGSSSGAGDDDESPANQNQSSSLNSSQTNKRKRIYSHCHVQDEENKKPDGVDRSARRRLIAASIICLIFMIGEVVGGVLSNSLAIASDAAHLLTDFASFMISLFAIWLGSRPASRKMSFGWYRAEVIGALVSVLMIWLVTGLLVYMAIERLRTSEYEIDSQVMVITASAGLLVNIIMALALNVDGHSHGFHGHSHGHGHGHNHHHNHNHEEGCETDIIDTSAQQQQQQQQPEHTIAPLLNGSSNGSTPLASSEANKKLSGSGELQTTNLSNSSAIHMDNNSSLQKQQQQKVKQTKKHQERGRGKSNINVRAAFIHVIGDFLQSLGVLIAALVIHFVPEYSFIDPICTFLFSVIVLITTINIIRDAINVLMEGIPDGINFIEVREKLQDLPSVIRVHNLRIWSLSLDKIAISTHLVIDDSKTPSEALKMAIDTLKSSYNFFEVTIQVEEYKDDMRDCAHCQNEEVVINVVDNN